MKQLARTTRNELTRQQRNLLLAEPIARLSLERNNIFKDESVIDADIDLRFLALSALDFVMERTAIEAGATSRQIVTHIAGEVRLMRPALGEEHCWKIGQVVLDHLANARDHHKAFRTRYYDHPHGETRMSDFRLLVTFSAGDESVRFKLGQGAQTLTLAMLDIAPEFVQEAETIMIRKAVERGRFSDARSLAQRARIRSLHYQQSIEDKLFQARRDAERLVWSQETTPILDEARAHLRERRRNEEVIIDSIRDTIPQTTGEPRDQLLDLLQIIEDCHDRHQELFKRVTTASEDFCTLQASAFRTRYSRDIPDLEDRILVPLLGAPIGAVARLSDEIGVLFTAPSPPALLDLSLLFEICTQPKIKQDPVSAPGLDELVPLEPVAPTFTEEQIRTAQDWLLEALAERSALDMRTVILEWERQRRDGVTLRCLLFLMMRSWCRHDDPFGVIASIDGTIAHARATGDNLRLSRDAARWPI